MPSSQFARDIMKTSTAQVNRATASVIQTAQVDRAVAVAMKKYDADAVDADTIAAEERNLANQFAALQASLSTLNAHKRAYEERAAQEAELREWQAALRAEIDRAVERLAEQRREKLERAAAFDAELQASVNQLQDMQADVRRRAAALDAAYDASVNRLEASYVQAVASRRTQQASVPQPPPASTAVPPVVPSWVRNAAAVGSSCCSTSSEAPSVARMSFSASDHEAQATQLFGRMKYSSPPAL